MKKIKEMIRLKVAGMTQREIASSCGVGKTTVADTFRKLNEKKIDYRLLANETEEQIISLLEPEKSDTHHQLPDWTQIAANLAKKGMTTKIAWMRYREQHEDGLSYSQFCHHLKVWKKESQMPMVFNYQPGEYVFVDFSGLTVPYYDEKTSEVRQAEIFVATCGYSGMTFVHATSSQQKQEWLRAHSKMFNYFGGVFQKVVPDNLKSAVKKPCRYEPELNPAYRELAHHYNTAILPARSGKPKDKARVEKAVRDIQSAILVPLELLTFTSVSEINIALEPHLKKFNLKKYQKFEFSRADLFQETANALLPLPTQDYEFPEWKKAKVNIDYHIEIFGHYYSVPFRHRGEHVEVRATCQSVEVFLGGRRIATHKRSFEKARHTTEYHHMPPKHQKHVDWTPDRLLSWARQIGPSVSIVCEKLMSSREIPEQSFRSCLGILRLSKKYSCDELEKACEYALSIQALTYRSVAAILSNKNYLQKQSHPNQKTLEPHQNIRGSNYYK